MRGVVLPLRPALDGNAEASPSSPSCCAILQIAPTHAGRPLADFGTAEPKRGPRDRGRRWVTGGVAAL